MRKKSIICIFAALLVLIMTAGLGRANVSHAAEIYNNYVFEVIADSADGFCAFRTGPGVEYSMIREIYNGTQLRITALTRNYNDGLVWGETRYNGVSGWISIMNTFVYNVENASNAVYDVRVTLPDYICLREGPGAEFAALYWPYEGQVLRIDQTIVNMFDGRPWGRTTINGMQGWVSLNWTARDSSVVYNQSMNVEFYDNIYYVYVQIGDNSTYFNNGPGYSYSLINWIPNRTSLMVFEAYDSSYDKTVWGKTMYGGRFGWIPMEYTVVTEVANASKVQYYVTVQNSSNIVLRNGPGTEYSQVYFDTIPNGAGLYITQTVINSFDGRPWGKTAFNGYEGWVSLNWTYREPGN